MKISKTGSFSAYIGTVIQSSAADYPKDWPKITEIFNKFGGWRPTRYKFIIKASLSEVEKLL